MAGVEEEQQQQEHAHHVLPHMEGSLATHKRMMAARNNALFLAEMCFVAASIIYYIRVDIFEALIIIWHYLGYCHRIVNGVILSGTTTTTATNPLPTMIAILVVASSMACFEFVLGKLYIEHTLVHNLDDELRWDDDDDTSELDTLVEHTVVNSPTLYTDDTEVNSAICAVVISFWLAVVFEMLGAPVYSVLLYLIVAPLNLDYMFAYVRGPAEDHRVPPNAAAEQELQNAKAGEEEEVPEAPEVPEVPDGGVAFAE